MDFEQIRNGIEDIANTILLIVIPLMAIIIARRILLEKKNTGEWNKIRVLIFSVFFCYIGVVTSTFILETSPIGVSPYGKYFLSHPMTILSLYVISLGLLVSLSNCLVAYANKWEPFYYTALFIFGSMFIFYFFTGFETWVMPYIYIAAIIGISFMFITGFRLKDNGALGIGIFFTIAFSSLILSTILNQSILSDILYIIHGIFGLYFALGKFQPFKEEDIKNE